MFCCDNNSNMKKCNCKNEALKTLRNFHKSYILETRYFSSIIQNRKIKDYWEFDL